MMTKIQNNGRCVQVMGKYYYENTMFFGLDLSDEQKEMIRLFQDKKIIFVEGKAGTGKTQIAIGCAKLYGKDLHYIINPVEEKRIGYLPGTVDEKLENYFGGVKSALIAINESPEKVIFSEDNIEAIKNRAYWVFTESGIFMRGTNLSNCTIIIDEAQNFTVSELRKVITRCSDDCKIVIMGNMLQCDLPDESLSGFHIFKQHFESKPYCGVVTLTKNYRGEIANYADEIEPSKYNYIDTEFMGFNKVEVTQGSAFEVEPVITKALLDGHFGE